MGGSRKHVCASCAKFQRQHTHQQDMATRAAVDALASWGGPRGDITHVVFGTMSAVSQPDGTSTGAETFMPA